MPREGGKGGGGAKRECEEEDVKGRCHGPFPSPDTGARRTGGRASQMPAADRSPDLVRNRLSGFQGGIRQAKDQDQASGMGEENGR